MGIGCRGSASKPVGAGFSLRPGPRSVARTQAKDLRLQILYRHLRRIALAAVAGLALAAGGCRQDMHDQPKYQPLERSAFFDDHRASRPLLPGTVARGHLDDDTALFQGMKNNVPIDYLPYPFSRAVLDRGHERYDIYCSPCHDRVGTGHGMIVQRGFKQPPSFHADRLRGMPLGYFFQVISNGFGVMPSYAAQVPVRDRWAIATYLRALQLSQNATLDDVPEEERARLLAQRSKAGGNP
jgi:Cytochrome C oxidase, cbb3-type, subunit III